MASNAGIHKELEDFFYSFFGCIEKVQECLSNRGSIPLEYIEHNLEGHFQIVLAIFVTLRENNVEQGNDLLMLFQLFLKAENVIYWHHFVLFSINFLTNERKEFVVQSTRYKQC